VERKVERRIKIFKYLNYGENLRPFFSVEEMERGLGKALFRQVEKIRASGFS
jgi:hypothetical protein